MPAIASTSKSPGLAVLFVNSVRAEWYEVEPSGAVNYGSCPVEGEAPNSRTSEPSAEALANAALGAVRAAGSTVTSCILALGADFAQQRFLSLPELKKVELKQVLLRKAAAHLKLSPEDTVFSAREFSSIETDGAAEKGVSKHWLLMALKRSLVSSLRLALRTHGFDVKRTVSARWSGICEVNSRQESSEKGSIVISVEPDAVAVSLVGESSLLTQNVLQGSLATNPRMASVLIQEVRSYEAYWRKRQRGAMVESVGIIGIDAAAGESLCAAIRVALPQTEVALLLRHAEHEQAGRCESLAACNSGGPLALDLTIPLPARRMVTALVLGCLTLFTLSVGLVTHARMFGDLEQVQAEAERLMAESRELAQLEDELDRVERQAQMLEVGIASILSARRSGYPLDSILGELFSAFRQRGSILTLNGSRVDSGGQVVVSGQTSSSPLEALTALEAIREELEASDCLAKVVCEPSSQLPTRKQAGEERSDGLEFKLKAVREDVQ